MSQLPFGVTTNKICEAYGCDNRATTQIEVQVGKFGTIPLNLCVDCASLFETNQHKNRELSNNSKGMIGDISHQPTEDWMEQSKLFPKQTTLKELL